MVQFRCVTNCVHGAKLPVVIGMHATSERAARSKGCGGRVPSQCSSGAWRCVCRVQSCLWSFECMHLLNVLPGLRGVVAVFLLNASARSKGSSLVQYADGQVQV